MTLVDTTVWIDFFRNTGTPQVRELERLIESNEDICTCGVVLTEVLQGIRNDADYRQTVTAFDAFIFLPMAQQTFQKAAELYRALRSKGFTIRNSIDCMIAAVAIEHDMPLLHNDRDYDVIASLGILKIANPEKPTRRNRRAK